MPPARDIAWKFVTIKHDEKKAWTCPYCPKQGSGIGRVKAHFLGLPQKGVTRCARVPEYIRDLLQSLVDEKVDDRDIAWKFVNRRGDNDWLCHHCEGEFSGDVTRLKRHVISICTKVPGPVKSLMLSLLGGMGEEASGEATDRSSAEGLHDTLTQNFPYTPGDENFVDGLLRNPEKAAGMANFTQQDVIQLTSDEQPQGEHLQSLERNKHLIANGSDGGSSDPRLEPCTRGHANDTIRLKRKLDELFDTHGPLVDELLSHWKAIEEASQSVEQADREKKPLPPEKVKVVEDLCERGKALFAGLGRSRQDARARAEECRRGYYPVPTELVGQKTHEKINEIYYCLIEYNISIIGVYGERKVGKTAILKNVRYKLLKAGAFNNVFWVTVPQDFTEYALQEAIANAVGLENLSNEGLDIRADMLHEHLKVKDRSIIIFDGLSKAFVLKKVGIPAGVGVLKLVLTTESLGVCREMQCQKEIQVEFLDMEAAWTLFLKTLCFAGKLSFQDEKTAKSVVDSCAGRPSRIIDVATILRGVENEHEWNEKLREMERDVAKGQRQLHGLGRSSCETQLDRSFSPPTRSYLLPSLYKPF